MWNPALAITRSVGPGRPPPAAGAAVPTLPQMQDEDKRRYVFVAIDRATRWVFIAIKQHKTAAAARSFLAAVRKAAAFQIHTILTDNG